MIKIPAAVFIFGLVIMAARLAFTDVLPGLTVCAASGVPEEKQGEAAKAEMAPTSGPDATADELIGSCREKLGCAIMVYVCSRSKFNGEKTYDN